MLKSRYLTYQINPAATQLVSYPQMQSQTVHEKKILNGSINFLRFTQLFSSFFVCYLLGSDSFFLCFVKWVGKKLVSVQLNCALQSNLENVPQCAFQCFFLEICPTRESEQIKDTSLIQLILESLLLRNTPSEYFKHICSKPIQTQVGNFVHIYIGKTISLIRTTSFLLDQTLLTYITCSSQKELRSNL